MVKYLFLIVVSLIWFASCNINPQSGSQFDSSYYVNPPKVDSPNQWYTKMIDTDGLYTSPVEVLYDTFMPVKDSDFVQLGIIFKNISQKKIVAVQFSLVGGTIFNEPDTIDTHPWGLGVRYVDNDTIYPGESNSPIWKINNPELRKIFFAWPTNVAFDDGETWQLHNN
jgi:hypothetical protein